MFINIVTPCSRPKNIQTIFESICIPLENYHWYVVFDLDYIPKTLPIHPNITYISHRDDRSKALPHGGFFIVFMLYDARRKVLNITQKHLSEMVGVTFKSISEIELNQRNPTLDTITKILDVLGCEINYTVKSIN